MHDQLKYSPKRPRQQFCLREPNFPPRRDALKQKAAETWEETELLLQHISPNPSESFIQRTNLHRNKRSSCLETQKFRITLVPFTWATLSVWDLPPAQLCWCCWRSSSTKANTIIIIIPTVNIIITTTTTIIITSTTTSSPTPPPPPPASSPPLLPQSSPPSSSPPHHHHHHHHLHDFCLFFHFFCTWTGLPSADQPHLPKEAHYTHARFHRNTQFLYQKPNLTLQPDTNFKSILKIHKVKQCNVWTSGQVDFQPDTFMILTWSHTHTHTATCLDVCVIHLSENTHQHLPGASVAAVKRWLHTRASLIYCCATTTHTHTRRQISMNTLVSVFILWLCVWSTELWWKNKAQLQVLRLTFHIWLIWLTVCVSLHTCA